MPNADNLKNEFNKISQSGSIDFVRNDLFSKHTGEEVFNLVVKFDKDRSFSKANNAYSMIGIPLVKDKDGNIISSLNEKHKTLILEGLNRYSSKELANDLKKAWDKTIDFENNKTRSKEKEMELNI